MGVAFTLGVFMFFQDVLGLEGYVEYVRHNWIELHWAVGAGFAAFWLTAHMRRWWLGTPSLRQRKRSLRDAERRRKSSGRGG